MLLSLMASNHNNSKNHYNNCPGYKQSKSQPIISLTAIPHKVRWLRLSEQNFRVDKWNLCRG